MPELNSRTSTKLNKFWNINWKNENQSSKQLQDQVITWEDSIQDLFELVKDTISLRKVPEQQELIDDSEVISRLRESGEYLIHVALGFLLDQPAESGEEAGLASEARKSGSRRTGDPRRSTTYHREVEALWRQWVAKEREVNRWRRSRRRRSHVWAYCWAHTSG